MAKAKRKKLFDVEVVKVYEMEIAAESQQQAEKIARDYTNADMIDSYFTTIREVKVKGQREVTA